MAQFLLIHGSAHGAWCWRDLIPALQALGHQATAIDLPGHGADPLPYAEVTLDRYASRIADTLRDLAAAGHGDVILVGHSMGGYPISLAAELCPDALSHLVYLCAYVPRPGASLNDRRREAAEQPLLGALILTEDRKGWTVADHDLDRLFYHDCPPGTLGYARAHLTIQAAQPSRQPVEITENSQSISRSYILCENDGTIPPALQHVMARDWPMAHVLSMDCGHSPFFADPIGLAGHLDMIAKG